MNARLWATAAATLWLVLTLSVQAATVNWTYKATISTTHNGTTSPDLLGVDGETVSFTLLFDDTDVWTAVSGRLYFSPYSFLTALSGGHVLTLNTSGAAATYANSCCAYIAEQVGSESYVDFVIDGNLTLMSGNGLGVPSGPTIGDHLLPAHLPTSLETYTFFEFSDASGTSARYNLVKESIQISVHQAPEPGTLALLGLGLVGLVATRKLKQ